MKLFLEHYTGLWLIISVLIFIFLIIWEGPNYDWKELKKEFKELFAILIVKSIDFIVLSILDTKNRNRKWNYHTKLIRRKR